MAPSKEILGLVALGAVIGSEGRPDCAGRIGPDMGFGARAVRDHLSQGAGIVGRIGDDAADPFKAFDQGCGLRAIAAPTCHRNPSDRKPDAVPISVMALGLIGLATVAVALMIPLINANIDSPMLRINTIMLESYVALYLGSATQLGEIGRIIGLVIAFILTLLDPDAAMSTSVTGPGQGRWRGGARRLTLVA